MKEVIVQFAPHVIGTAQGLPHQAAFQTAKSFGLTLRAIHPQSDDPALSRWFYTQVENGKAAELIQTLRSIPEVTAAYVKPPAEAP
jgi:hypothetical protein